LRGIDNLPVPSGQVVFMKTTSQSKENFKKRQLLYLSPQVQPGMEQEERESTDLRKERSETKDNNAVGGGAPPKAGYGNWVGLLLIVVAVAAIAMSGGSSGKYTAHEWGTFTSVQGGDGNLIDWRPLESSHLPQFVYNWTRPGLNRQPTSMQVLGKSGMVTLQRMETPVIYFYSDQEETVDISVAFPKGLITEWYPQACQIGPSTMAVPPAIARLDEYAHKAGVKPEFTFASLFGNKTIKESRARWANVRILPAKKNRALDSMLPQDRTGSHYFAARATDADYLRLSSLTATNPEPELEKFIFYRGAGNFATPLRVTMATSDEVTVANTGAENLSHLFVLSLNNGVGNFIYVDRLPPGEERTVWLDLKGHRLQLEELSGELGDKMAESLVHEGLYQREATAMVNTWKDSWFAEDGVRVLYVLPRSWTDRTLPLTLDPTPREVARVMVGRAEVLSPEVEQRLAETLARARGGDEAARAEVISQFKKLGRFGEPALRLATKGASMELTQAAWKLFQTASAASKGEPYKAGNSL